MGSSTQNNTLSPLRKKRTSLSFSESDYPLTATIAAKVSRELSAMREILGDHVDDETFRAMDRWTRCSLQRIGNFITSGSIRPEGNVRHGAGHGSGSMIRRPVRLGVFPISANPLHWLHVLSGFAAIESFRLDKVLYVIAGEDSRKPTLAPEHQRHSIARGVLDLFHPLLEYSPIARGSSLQGEENVFRLIADTGLAPLHIFYIAGSDHYRRSVPMTRAPDTIQKLEDGIRMRACGFDPSHHKLSAVFLDRGGHKNALESFLDVRWIHDLPLQTSSTKIRHALGGEGPLSELFSLPFSAYSKICANGLYRMKRDSDRVAQFDDRAEQTGQGKAPSEYGEEVGLYMSCTIQNDHQTGGLRI